MKRHSSLTVKILSLCMVVFTLLSIVPAVFAVEPANTLSPASVGEDVVSPMIEETGWYYRTYNGLLQMRLWSYTEGVWLTDWITIGTAA